MLATITTKNEWDDVLEKVDAFDVYHTYDYHINAAKPGEKSVLLYYTNDTIHIAQPLLIRSIPNSDYFDATSVYGYSGPLSSGLTKHTDLNDFHQAIRAYFKEEQVISVFSSLNPFIDHQKKIISGLGKIEYLGKVVNINTSLSLGEQEAQYSKTTKRYIKRNRNLFYARRGKSEDDITMFLNLYHQTMKRLKAHENYFFSAEYFEALIASNAYETEIIFAITKDTHSPISAILLLKTNHKIVQYHLSGTHEAYKYLSPIRFLIDEIRQIATREGYAYFNLGGGFGSKKDSLFDFKASFSADHKKFKVWKFILDGKAYDDLVLKNDAISTDAVTNYFPLYRYKKRN
jgi:hypothetical protein